MTIRRDEVLENLTLGAAPAASRLDTNPLARAVSVAMTAAASGSNGIRFLSSAAAAIGAATNFTVHAAITADYINSDGDTLVLHTESGLGQCYIKRTTGVMGYGYTSGVLESTQAIPVADLSAGVFTWVVTRQTVSVAGSIIFYCNGVQLGTSVPIPASSPENVLPSGTFGYFLGTNAVRRAGNFREAILYNRALSASEVLSLVQNGPALADLSANQVPLKTFNFSAGSDGLVGSSGTIAGNIDGIGGVDNTCRLTATTTNSTRFVLQNFPAAGFRTKTKIRVYRPAANVGATGLLVAALTGNSTSAIFGTAVQIPADTWTEIDIDLLGSGVQDTWVLYFTNSAGSTGGFSSGDIFYIESNGTITKLGITTHYNAMDAQSNTGQVFDRSGNGNHALLPAAGATVIPQKMNDCEVRGKLTWTASSTAQDVVGVNQAIIPVNGVWQPSFMIRSSDSITVNIGDGSSATRYGSAVVLAAGINIVTPTTRTHDGTNRRLVITPTGSSTAIINVLAKYDMVEAV